MLFLELSAAFMRYRPAAYVLSLPASTLRASFPHSLLQQPTKNTRSSHLRVYTHYVHTHTNNRRLRRHIDPRALMQRDRANAQLGLQSLDTVPTDVLREALRDACRRLSVSDPAAVGPAISKLARVVAVVPRLAAFVNAVCSAVFAEAGSSSSSSAGQGSTAMEEVCTVYAMLHVDHVLN
jgi:hypothetical protein